MSTSRWIELGAAAPAAVAAGLVLWGVYRWLRARRIPDPRLCPGPESGRWRWLRPRNWLTRRACGYDLTGLPRDEAGACVCPECGRAVTPGLPLAKIVVRWRMLPLAAALMVVAAGMWNVRWLRRGGWVPYAPTTLLIGLQRTAPWFVHEQVRWRLASRMENGEVSAWQKRWLIPAAIEALGDDGVKWNADWAKEILCRIGDETIPALEAALLSEDYQRRQVAAGILRRRADADPTRRWRWYAVPATADYRPSDNLLRVTVEGLGDDDLTYSCCTQNARDGFEFLLGYGDRIEPFVREGLEQDDVQRKGLCAVLAGVCGLDGLTEMTGPLLVGHLRHDGVRENAKSAIVGLRSMGRPAVKHLQRVWDSPDRQQRTLARLILLEIGVRTQFTDDVEMRCELMREEGAITAMSSHPVSRLSASDLRGFWW